MKLYSLLYNITHFKVNKTDHYKRMVQNDCIHQDGVKREFADTVEERSRHQVSTKFSHCFILLKEQ